MLYERIFHSTPYFKKDNQTGHIILQVLQLKSCTGSSALCWGLRHLWWFCQIEFRWQSVRCANLVLIPVKLTGQAICQLGVVVSVSEYSHPGIGKGMGWNREIWILIPGLESAHPVPLPTPAHIYKQPILKIYYVECVTFFEILAKFLIILKNDREWPNLYTQLWLRSVHENKSNNEPVLPWNFDFVDNFQFTWTVLCSLSKSLSSPKVNRWIRKLLADTQGFSKSLLIPSAERPLKESSFLLTPNN